MTGPDAAAAYASLYSPSADDMRRSLPEIGDGLHAQLHELYVHPTAWGAEQLAANLSGAQRACLRLAEAIRREGLGDGQ
jgi:hypothetical protein